MKSIAFSAASDNDNALGFLKQAQRPVRLDKMDFHAAVEKFAEAWVVANTPTTVVTTERQVKKFSERANEHDCVFG